MIFNSPLLHRSCRIYVSKWVRVLEIDAYLHIYIDIHTFQHTYLKKVPHLIVMLGMKIMIRVQLALCSRFDTDCSTLPLSPVGSPTCARNTHTPSSASVCYWKHICTYLFFSQFLQYPMLLSKSIPFKNGTNLQCENYLPSRGQFNCTEVRRRFI